MKDILPEEPGKMINTIVTNTLKGQNRGLGRPLGGTMHEPEYQKSTKSTDMSPGRCGPTLRALPVTGLGL